MFERHSYAREVWLLLFTWIHCNSNCFGLATRSHSKEQSQEKTPGFSEVEGFLILIFCSTWNMWHFFFPQESLQNVSVCLFSVRIILLAISEHSLDSLCRSISIRKRKYLHRNKWIMYTSPASFFSFKSSKCFQKFGFSWLSLFFFFYLFLFIYIYIYIYIVITLLYFRHLEYLVFQSFSTKMNIKRIMAKLLHWKPLHALALQLKS